MSKLPLHFIGVGLPPDHPAIPFHIQPQIAAGCRELEATFSRCNAHLSLLYIAPGTMDDFIAYLKQHGSELDGVVIGFGVRGMVPLTVFFEQVVDAVRVHAPKAKLLFNTSPGDTMEAIQRHFPEVREQGENGAGRL